MYSTLFFKITEIISPVDKPWFFNKWHMQSINLSVSEYVNVFSFEIIYGLSGLDLAWNLIAWDILSISGIIGLIIIHPFFLGVYRYHLFS